GSVAAIKNGEDQCERQSRENTDGTAGLFLGLECALQAGEESFRKGSGRDLPPHAGDHVGKIGTCLDIREHDHASPSVFPQDLIRPVGLPNIGDLARWNPSDRCFYEEVAKALRRAHALRQAHGHVETPIAIDDSRYYATVGEPAELLDDPGRLTPIARGATKVDADFELRNADLLFHLQVDEARDLRKLFAEPF